MKTKDKIERHIKLADEMIITICKFTPQEQNEMVDAICDTVHEHRQEMIDKAETNLMKIKAYLLRLQGKENSGN